MNPDARFAPAFQQLIDAPAQSLADLQVDPAGFAERTLAGEQQQLHANAALFDERMLAFLLFDAAGRRVTLETQAWAPTATDFDALVKNAIQRSNPRLMAIEQAGGHTLHLVWAPLAETAGWNLPAHLRALVQACGSGRLVLMTGGGDEGPIDAAARGFNLTDLERRIVVAVVRTGGARDAAQQIGVTYGTARDALANAARKMRQPNMPAMVQTIVAAAFGIFPDQIDSAEMLSDMLQLSKRQAQVALLVAAGLSREETARAIGISAAVVKKELELLYAHLGLSSAAELARLIVEVQALRIFTRSTDSAPGFLDAAIEPSRIAVRPGGRETVAWSDYGPASGQPVLVVHSNWACRAVPRPLVRALQARGFRPIAIDRAGFGATHPGRLSERDPYSQSIDDTLQILDTAGIERVAVVARCGAQFVHMLKARAPARIGPVVLVSPTPQTSAECRRTGVVGAIKEAFYSSPALIELFFRIVSAQMTFARIEHLTQSIVKGSACDEALCDNPEFIRDRFRACRPFASGNMSGAIFEERVISHGGFDFPSLDVDDWCVMQGDDDVHNGFADVERHWRPILPNSPFLRIEGGGRFLTSSHPERIVDTLERLCNGRPLPSKADFGERPRDVGTSHQFV